MDQGRTVKKVFESKVKRWQQRAVSREGWTCVIKEAKFLKGLWSQEVSK